MEMGEGLKTPRMMLVESTIGRPRSVDKDNGKHLIVMLIGLPVNHVHRLHLL